MEGSVALEFPTEGAQLITEDADTTIPGSVIDVGAECLRRSIGGLETPRQLKMMAPQIIRRIYRAMIAAEQGRPVWVPVTGFEDSTGLQTWELRLPEKKGTLYRTTNEGGPGLDTAISTVWVPDESPDECLRTAVREQGKQINQLVKAIEMLVNHQNDKAKE